MRLRSFYNQKVGPSTYFIYLSLPTTINTTVQEHKERTGRLRGLRIAIPVLHVRDLQRRSYLPTSAATRAYLFASAPLQRSAPESSPSGLVSIPPVSSSQN